MLTAIISALIEALGQTIMNFCLVGSAQIGQMIVKAASDTLCLDGNPIDNLVNAFLPNSSTETQGLIFSDGIPSVDVSLGDIIIAISIGLIISLVIIQGITSLLNTANGEKTDSILSYVLHGVIAVFAIYVLYGGFINYLNPNSDGIISGVLQALFVPVKVISEKLNALPLDFDNIDKFTAPSFNLVAYSGVLIVSGGILAGILSGALSILERCITIAVHIVTGPIFIAFTACKETASSAVEWFKSIVIQAISLDISMLIWYMALIQLDTYLVKLHGASWGQTFDGETFIEAIPIGAIAIVLFSLVGSIEEIFKAVGFKVTSSRDATKLIAGGMAASTKAIGTVAKEAGVITGFTDKAGLNKKIENSGGNILRTVGSTLTGHRFDGQKSALEEKNEDFLDTANKIAEKAKRNEDSGTVNSISGNSKNISFGKNTDPSNTKKDLTYEQQQRFAYNMSNAISSNKGCEIKRDPTSTVDGNACVYNGVNMALASTKGSISTGKDREKAGLNAQAFVPEGSVDIARVGRLANGSEVALSGAYDPETGTTVLASTNSKDDLSTLTAIRGDDNNWISVAGVEKEGIGNYIRGGTEAQAANGETIKMEKTSLTTNDLNDNAVIRINLAGKNVVNQETCKLYTEAKKENAKN